MINVKAVASYEESRKLA